MTAATFMDLIRACTDANLVFSARSGGRGMDVIGTKEAIEIATYHEHRSLSLEGYQKEFAERIEALKAEVVRLAAENVSLKARIVNEQAARDEKEISVQWRANGNHMEAYVANKYICRVFPSNDYKGKWRASNPRGCLHGVLFDSQLRAMEWAVQQIRKSK